MPNPMARRIAQRWQQRQAATLTFEWPNGFTSPEALFLMFEDGEQIGYLRVRWETPVPELIPIARCPESLQALYDQYGEGPVVKGWVTEIKWAKRKQGYGLKMYAAAIKDLKRKFPGGFYFIPSMCGKKGEGSTTTGAQRLWKALARKYPSVGKCLYIR